MNYHELHMQICDAEQEAERFVCYYYIFLTFILRTVELLVCPERVILRYAVSQRTNFKVGC